VSLVLLGLTARELGGGRLAQVIALGAGLPVALVLSSMMQYTTPDYFAWMLMTFFTAKLLRTEDERWWLGVGAAIGIGVLSKYSIAFPVAGMVLGMLVLPSQRQHLRSGWFWAGVGVGFVVCAPNLIWLARHHFITLTMESFIHTRDVRMGRADGYYSD
jgi:4-amino-4-deoxy-L-arabinose transferase-like glycosyltransferase